MTSLRPGISCPFAAGVLAMTLHMPCMAAAPSYAAADASTAAVAPPALPPGSRYLPLGDAMHVQGQPVSAWVFDAPGSLPDIAGWLTARQPALHDLWVMPGTVVLAGIADGMHWVARLSDARAGRTQGTISALRLGHEAKSGGFGHASMPGTRHKPSAAGARQLLLPDAEWRLDGGQLHFELHSKDGNAAIVEQIWTHVAAPFVLRKNVIANLVSAGWRPADTAVAYVAASGIVDPAAASPDVSGSDTKAIRQWSRGRATLSIVIVPLDQGSGVMAVLRIGA